MQTFKLQFIVTYDKSGLQKLNLKDSYKENYKNLEATKKIVQSYIDNNLFSTEQEFARVVLKYSHNPKLLLINLQELAPFKEYIQMKVNELFVQQNGYNMPTEAALTNRAQKKNGVVKQNVINMINDSKELIFNKGAQPYLSNKNETPNQILFESQKEIVATNYFSFQSGKYGDNGIILRRVLKCTHPKTKKSYIVNEDIRIYSNSTKMVTDFQLLINGDPKKAHYIARLDTVGFMNEDFLNKYNIDFEIPSDIEQEARKEYEHDNYYPKHLKTKQAKTCSSNSHLHLMDENFELLKAAMFVYKDIMANKDPFIAQEYKNYRTKMNAVDIDFYKDDYDTQQAIKEKHTLKLKHAKEYKGVLPIEQILAKTNEMLNISYNPEFELSDETYAYINRGRDPKRNLSMSDKSIQRMEEYNRSGELILN